MPIARFEMPDGRVARFKVPEGTTPDQANTLMQSYMAEQTPPKQEQSFDFAEFATKPPTLEGLGRSTAQFAGAATEGIAELADIIVSPVTETARRTGLIDSTPMAETVRQGAGAVGIPEASGPVERVATGTAKMVGPAIATMGVGGPLASSSGPVASGVGRALASQPGMQAATATSGGLATNLAKEDGQGPLTQFVAALAAGLAPITAKSITTNAIKTFGQATTKAAEEIIARNNIDMTGMSISARKQLLDQVKAGVKAGNVNEAALKRYIDYAKLGATPTKGRVTLDQIQLTHEKNLAKIGATSHDKSLQALSNIERQNDALLTQRINELGAENADDAFAASTKLINTLKAVDAPRNEAVNKAYQAVRDSKGRYAFLNTKQFSEKANQYLDEEMLGSALPVETRKILNDISSGKTPFNVNTMIQLDKRLSGQTSVAMRSGNKESAKAVGQVRKALSETELDQNMSDVGEQTIALYEKARQMAANRFSIIDDTPALKAALDNVEPDKFVQTFVTGTGNKANFSDVKSLAQELSKNPESLEIARNQIAKYLRDKATGSAADEVASFSAAAYNRALRQIGNKKLKLFFGKDGLEDLKRIGRVSSYEKFRPVGSAVNTSNTAATMIGRSADLTDQALGWIPGVGKYVSPMAANALRGVSASRESQLAMDKVLANQLSQGGMEALAAPIAGMVAGNQ